MNKLFLICFIPFLMGFGPFTDCELACETYASFTTGEDGNVDVAMYAGNEYIGTTFTDSSASGIICTVKWYMGSDAGSPSVNDYYVEIWAMSGDALTGSALARSNKVDGSDSWEDTWVEFEIYFAYSQSTTYAIFLKAIDDGDSAATVGEYDGTNNTSFRYDNENDGTAMFGGRFHWNSGTLALTSKDVEDDMLIEVYTY